MTRETKEVKSAVQYSTPEFVSLGSVEKLTGGSNQKQQDPGQNSTTYIYSDIGDEKPAKDSLE